MEMVMLLLVSALAQLVSPTPVNHPHSNLYNIIDITKQYKESVTQSLFVEDVQELAEAGCKNDFFCKVEDILKNHYKEKKGKEEKEEALVRNLQSFINQMNITCSEELKTAPKPSVTRPITNLLTHLDQCCKKRNLSPKA